MASPTQPDSFAALDARIVALRAARRPARSAVGQKFNNASLAWRMVVELVVGVMLGAGVGWGLDSLAGTTPAFLIVFIVLGFAAGVKTMMRTAAEQTRRDHADAATTAADGRDTAARAAQSEG